MTTMTEQIRVLREALVLIRNSRDFHRLVPSSQKIISDALAATIQPVAVPEPVGEVVASDLGYRIQWRGAWPQVGMKLFTAAPAQAAPDAQYKAQRDRLLDFIKNAQVSSGVCMCGSSVEGHGFGDGHSPVDVWDYSVMKLIEEIEAQDATTTTQAAPPAASQTGEGDAY